MSGFGSLFTNRALGLEDNAQLLANIVGANVGEHGAVLFDDLHQGLGATYDPDKFYKDRRLYVDARRACGRCGSCGCWAPRGLRVPVSQHLRAARSGADPRRRRIPLRVRLPAHAGARRLLDNFFRRVSARAGERRDARRCRGTCSSATRASRPRISSN